MISSATDEADLGRPFAAARPHLVTSTYGLPAEERFDMWCDEFSPLHDIGAEPAVRADFSASARHWQLGPLAFAIFDTPPRKVIRSRRRCAADGLEHLSLLFPVTAVLRVDDITGSVRRGGVAIRSVARSYRCDFGGGVWLAVMMPRDVDAALVRRLDSLAPFHCEGQGAAALSAFALSLTRRLPDARAEDLPVLGGLMVEMIATCLLDHPNGAADRIGRARVERLIREHLGSARLDVELLARLSGMSRSGLHRQFRTEGGVARHVQATRMRLVRRDLADPADAGVSIAALAARRGFHDAAAFNRAFHRAHGCTPGAFRAAAVQARGRTPEATARHFADLLRRAN